MTLKLPTAIALSLLLAIALAGSAVAQQKRQAPAKTQTPPAPAPAPTPPPTFDTLLAANSYKVYGEIRSVGQFIKSNSVTEILEPILGLAGPPEEFRTVIKWLNSHADEVMSSRMFVAGAPSSPATPGILIGIEFASAEEAAKFHQKLNKFLTAMLPPPAPDPAAETKKDGPPQPPPYHMQQAGSLLLITPTPLDVKKLRPAGSKLLADDVNFRIARNRFNTESIFVFVDVAAIEKEDEQRERQMEANRKTMAEKAAANPEKTAPAETPKTELQTEPEKLEPLVTENVTVGVAPPTTELNAGPPPEDKARAQQAQESLMVLSMIMSSLTGLEGKMPAAVGVAISLESDSFDLRALLINAPGEKSDPIPFFPVLAPGPAIVFDAPNILPADTESLVAMSLDLPHIYTALSKPPPAPAGNPGFKPAHSFEFVPPFAALEKRLKLNLKDDVLPLLGSEIAVSIPTGGVDWFQPPKPDPSLTSSSSPSPSPSPEASPNANATLTASANTPGDSKTGFPVVIAVSLRDKEGMRALLPKVIESLAFKGASSFAQTERREDTELVSYANILSYAFIGNFLVISPDAAATRHVVDSYLKRETLSGDPHFKNYTRWQPQQTQGQIYISPTLMEGYRKWAQQPTAQIDDKTRAFLTRFTIVAQPITYALSNEGFGPMHELHLPKNLVLLLVAATSGSMNVPGPEDTPANQPPPPPSKPANPF
jgi:hypothetical protein